MKISTVLPGTRIAGELRTCSENIATAASGVSTIAEVLNILRENPPSELPVLRTACARLGDYLSLAVDQITIDSVNDAKHGFRAFLEARKYKENAVRAYVNHVRILLRHATNLGWKPNEAVPTQWRQVADLSAAANCRRVVKYLVRLRSTPTAVTLEDVDLWMDEVVSRGASYQVARRERNRLWNLLWKCGCTTEMPRCILHQKKIGVSIDRFPTPLRNEVLALLRWKQAEFAPDRPKTGRIRPVTAKKIQEMFRSIYGYCTTLHGQSEVCSVQQLIQKEVVSAYLQWGINERRLNGYSLQNGVRQLFAALCQYPPFKTLDFSWWKSLHDSIPVESASEKRRRKAEKYLDYSVLELIPSRIRAARSAMRQSNDRKGSELFMHELVALWLTILPWRQRNLRECRIEGKTPNLFKAKIPVYSEIDKPEWVQEEELRNPSAQFWQFNFSPEETKMKRRVHAILPRPLIQHLEEYLSVHRPRLVGDSSAQTLFVNGAAAPLDEDQMIQLVSTVTLKFGGRRVTPHLYRDITAFAWLKEHPEDYLTLSKILWHANISTTINTYAGRFNESSGVRAMETWVEKRLASR